MRTILPAVLLLLGCLVSSAAAQTSDALDETLSLVGMARADLGWTPRGWWPRFPDVPFKLRSFDSLFAHPLDSIRYARGLARVARDRLDPAALDKSQARGTRNLFLAVQMLGIDPMFGGFRGYTANVLAPEAPLNEAILTLIEASGHPTVINTFGMDLHYPRPREDLRAARLWPGWDRTQSPGARRDHSGRVPRQSPDRKYLRPRVLS